MTLPETWNQYQVWVLVQYSVLGATVVVTSVAVRFIRKWAREELTRVTDALNRAMDEREKRIADRDRTIAKLEAEARSLKGQLTKARNEAARRDEPRAEDET